MKNEKEIVSFFEKSGALQHGHFILSSGKRSKMYFQCSKLFVNPNDGLTAVSYTHLTLPTNREV